MSVIKKLLILLSFVVFIDSSAISADYLICTNENPNSALGGESDLIIDLPNKKLSIFTENNLFKIYNISEKLIEAAKYDKNNNIDEYIAFDRYNGSLNYLMYYNEKAMLEAIQIFTC
jgi:hypothetical protein